MLVVLARAVRALKVGDPAFLLDLAVRLSLLKLFCQNLGIIFLMCLAFSWVCSTILPGLSPLL